MTRRSERYGKGARSARVRTQSTAATPASSALNHAVEAVTDEHLAAARAGDEDGFAAVYQHVQPKLRRYAISLVGLDADDVTAEAWLQIVRDLANFRGDLDDFHAWTARIVRNRAMDLVRARSRRPVRFVPVDELPALPAPDDAELDALELISTTDAIALIATLPAGQAEAVVLRTVIGLDVAATAAVLGKRPAAVRVATHRGLAALARRLRGDGRNGR